MTFRNLRFFNIDRFKKGLQTLGLLNAVQQNVDVMQDLFVHTAVSLDATVIEHLLSVTYWSEAGSN